jgi:hypothetical protein
MTVAAATQRSSGELLVRYQFDPGARLELHFQTIDGRAFFFCPKRVPRSQGERVNVEFTAGAGQNACTLQGEVRGHEMGGTFTGSWIEFAASDLAGTLRKPFAALPSNVLLPVNAMVRLRRAGATQILCRVDAVSESEVRLGCLPAGVSVGERVSLAVLGGPPCDSDLGTGNIVWVEDRDARVEFARQELPRALVVLLHRARTRLGNPLEVRHPASCCCRNGTPPNQPPVPRAAHRRIS